MEGGKIPQMGIGEKSGTGWWHIEWLKHPRSAGVRVLTCRRKLGKPKNKNSRQAITGMSSCREGGRGFVRSPLKTKKGRKKRERSTQARMKKPQEEGDGKVGFLKSSGKKRSKNKKNNR